MKAPIFYTVTEVMGILRCGRSLFYELVKSGRLKTVKLAGKTLVRSEDLNDFVNSLGTTASKAA